MCDGFHGYFFNTDDDPAQALQALEAIGAVRTAAIVRRAFGRFPGGLPPRDRMERQAILLDVVTPGDDINVFEPEDNDLFAYPENVEEARSSVPRGLDGADVPGGGNRESTWIGPARRHVLKRAGGGPRF